MPSPTVPSWAPIAPDRINPRTVRLVEAFKDALARMRDEHGLTFDDLNTVTTLLQQLHDATGVPRWGLRRENRHPEQAILVGWLAGPGAGRLDVALINDIAARSGSGSPAICSSSSRVSLRYSSAIDAS